MWDPEWTRRDTWKTERRSETPGWRMTRHQAFLEDGVPAAYRGAQNPTARTPPNVRKGGALHAENCASCHDASGTGHGDAGLALYPSPALLTHLIRMPDAVDEYLMWAVAEGGEPFGTDTPADELTDEQIWQIIAYMRAGFPAIAETGRSEGRPTD